MGRKGNILIVVIAFLVIGLFMVGRQNISFQLDGIYSSYLRSIETTTNTRAGPLECKRRAITQFPMCKASMDEKCDSLPDPVLFKPGEHPLTALTSFPGSGNTWMRILLISLTGIVTGDAYNDPSLKKIKGMSSIHDDTVVAVKTHYPALPKYTDDFIPLTFDKKNVTRVIALIRHPMDAVLSTFNLYTTHNHTGVAKLANFLDKSNNPSPGWRRHFESWHLLWIRWIRYYTTSYKGDVHLIFYENLKADLSTELVKLNKFLNLPLDERRICCIAESVKKATFKRAGHMNKSMIFSSDMLKKTSLILDEARELLQKKFGSQIQHKLPTTFQTDAEAQKCWMQ